MGEHVTANLPRMRWLTGRVDEAASTMSGDAFAGPCVGALPAEAFGNSFGAEACHAAWSGAEIGARTAHDGLTAVLTSDVARLGEVIARFEQTDLESADAVSAAARGLNVFTTHVHHMAGPRGGEHDQQRARQLRTAIDHVAGGEGPTVFAGDLNEVRTSDTNSADAISGLVENAGYTDAGVAAGGTSSEGARIDYVFTSPEIDTPGIARRVEGHPSDHDGIAVDIAIPRDW